ncbi:hypothetical protein HDU98_000362 [Podochytrium sp. JEL0797]|nr:hypothetical protein HDU98_000362 [Podochytrium sp. JEL0797]
MSNCSGGESDCPAAVELASLRRILLVPEDPDLPPHDLAPPSRTRLSTTFLPPELLTRIASFTDAPSLLQLCHAIRSLKHVSFALWSLAQKLDRKTSFAQLWPHFLFPGAPPLERFSACLRTSNVVAFRNYFAVLAQLDGQVSICPQTALCLYELRPLVPKNLLLNVTFCYEERDFDHDDSIDTPDLLLENLAALQFRIGELTLPQFIPDEILPECAQLLKKIPMHTLCFNRIAPTLLIAQIPKIPNLVCLELNRIKKEPTWTFLSKCHNLLTLRIYHTNFSPKSVKLLVDALPGSKLTVVSFPLQLRVDIKSETLNEIGWKLETLNWRGMKWLKKSEK